MNFKAEKILPPLNKGKLTSSHIVRWCAAQQNWHKIHYDQSFAKNIDKLPDIVINGALKQHFLWQFLYEAFDGQGWVWRIDYQFIGMDFVGQELEVRGKITNLVRVNNHNFIEIKAEIFNIDKGEATTLAKGVVVLNESGEPVQELPEEPILPLNLRLSLETPYIGKDIQEKMAIKVNKWQEPFESDYFLDYSRLRLFADAIGGLRPIHYHPDSSSYGVNGKTVAPPLFPIHSIELLPDSNCLDEREDADGREGLTSLSGSLIKELGLSHYRVLNGGNSVEIFSLLSVGEKVVADSKLVKMQWKQGRTGKFLVLESINRYKELSTDRILLIESKKTILRQRDY